MRVFLCGANGFMGRRIQHTLEAAGHQVIAGVSHLQAGHTHQSLINFSTDTHTDVWLQRLSGVQAVVNAVGVLRGSSVRPIDEVHHLTPCAMFDACVQVGIGRVIQISALGVDESNTRYARTKRAADEHLLMLVKHSPHKLSASVLRPSMVFGRGGNSSTLLMNLAKMPILPLPGVMQESLIQPISVNDMAATVAALLERPHTGIIECTGPEPVRMGDLIASLRQQCGHSPAQIVPVPNWLAQASARVGDWLPAKIPWCTETVQLLQAVNIAHGNHAFAVPAILGRPSVHYNDFVKDAWLSA